ncbi:hypothetical protein JB92DRAFT_813420 [Gautieria morchelliformis]|nr:hypothetical protein JB92DRAFT_813420 [Gautieria morchelliformis]
MKPVKYIILNTSTQVEYIGPKYYSIIDPLQEYHDSLELPCLGRAGTSDEAIINYSLVASLAFLLYDHTITFDAEVMDIWYRPRSLGTALFIWGHFLSLSRTTCRAFLWWEAVSALALNVSVEVILMARVCSLVYASMHCDLFLLTGLRCL